jgi:hypothetical protein
MTERKPIDSAEFGDADFCSENSRVIALTTMSRRAVAEPVLLLAD